MELDVALIIVVTASVLVTFILNWIFKKKRYIKYLPIIVMFPFMLYNFIRAYSAPTEGFEALGRFVMGLLLFAASLPSLICSIILDIVHKKRTIDN